MFWFEDWACYSGWRFRAVAQGLEKSCTYRRQRETAAEAK